MLPSQMNKKYQILKDIFGHEHFRSFQEEVVDCILNKQDVLTILPTGGGKSLCYQLPTLLMNGTTVVISPLIALMQDQIKALNDLNISAEMISSATSNDENSFTLQKLLNGELKFIYVAPERFTSNEFVSVLQRININYFVIDNILYFAVPAGVFTSTSWFFFLPSRAAPTGDSFDILF